MQDYYDYLQTFGHPGPDLMRHVQDLPATLGADMTTELYAPTVAKIPLFYGVKIAFLENIIRGLNLCVFLKGMWGAPLGAGPADRLMMDPVACACTFYAQGNAQVVVDWLRIRIL